jgi:hypothetical protein
MRWLGPILLGTGLILSMLPGPAAAQTPEGVVAVITSPVDGQQLFGLADITGSAAHPDAFASYTLEYDELSEPAAQWFLVQERVTQQVQNDVLGAWNTNMVPDGVYQLRLRVFLDDGQIGEFVVSNLRVINSEPTPVPTVAVEPAGATPSTPTPGPSPTSLIEQPPGNDPSPGGISGLNTANSSSEAEAPTGLPADETDSQSTRINMARVRRAFCAGVYLAIGGFVIMLGYVLIRGPVRPYVRRLIWQIQDELDDR